jgi:HlyD family secretion protein
MKKIITIIVVLGAIGGAAYWWFGSKSETKVTFRKDVVDRGELVVSISATGTVNAVTTVTVGSQVSGTIAKLYADFNSPVKDGELLAQLDPTFLQASVNEQRANTDRAKAQYNEAKRNFDRTTELSARGLVSQADLDAATTSLESSKASLQQAEASLDRAQVNLRYATIRAPINGVVISRNVDVGQTVAASLQAPTLFTIAEDLSRMKVEASIDEADIGSVKEGQRVTFTVDSYPDEQFEGKVSQIRLAPVESQNVVTYTVIIDVSNPELKLMPGMTATVSVEVARRDDAMRVPLQALRFTPPGMTAPTPGQGRRGGGMRDSSAAKAPGGVQAAPAEQKQHRPNPNRAFIWVMENGTPKPIPVIRGIQNQRYAELVESPLNEGDTILVGTSSSSAAAATTQNQTNPFMPRMPGGPGAGGGRGR